MQLCLRHKQTKLRSMTIWNTVSEYQPWVHVSGQENFFSWILNPIIPPPLPLLQTINLPALLGTICPTIYLGDTMGWGVGRGEGGRESYKRNQRGFLDVERKLLLCTAKTSVDLYRIINVLIIVLVLMSKSI